MVERVAVLMGGWSAEREVSLATGRECAAGLRSAGYRVDEVEVDRDVATRLLSLKPDVCFNALHGRLGEDGNIQGLLNILGIPYTHSGVTASALAMNKPQAKTIFEAYGLVCPEGMVVDSDTAPGDLQFPPPFVVKPVDEGSSVGVTIVRTGDNREKVAGDIWPHGHHVLVERFIPPRTDRRDIRRASPLRHRDHVGSRLLRLRCQIRSRRLASYPAGRPASGDHPARFELG